MKPDTESLDKHDAVELVAYNALWPQMAATEIATLYKILPPRHIIDIQHIGSTAIPGMLAKPVIDIQVAVDSLSAVKQAAIDALTAQGYQYWYDNPDPECMFFVKGMPPFGDKRTHHVHIYELGSKLWRNKLLFRDYLRGHPKVADDYQQLKIQLMRQYACDREQYTEAKKDFVNMILQKEKHLSRT